MTDLKRRRFLVTAGTSGIAAAAATTLAAPAIAQTMPELNWRMTCSWPKSLDTLYGAAVIFADTLAALTDNKFKVQVFAAGELVPALQAVDAVSNGTVEACHTAGYYYWGKDPTFALATSIPFGTDVRSQQAWMYNAGGIDSMNEFFSKFKLYGLPCANTGTQMGGWFRKEINSIDDLKGLKFRVGGFAGAVLQRLGVVPQQLGAGDIYPALEKGTIDAAEWVGPYDDEKLGFAKVAKYYYYPGWWEGQAMLHAFFNLEKWNALPKAYQAAVKAACHVANTETMAKYDILNPAALRRLVGGGTELRPFNQVVLDACFKAAIDTYAEMSEKNADFKKNYEAMKAVRNEGFLWEQVAESSYDRYMMAQQSNGKL